METLRLTEPRETGEAPDPKGERDPAERRPGLLERLKRYAKDTVVAGTSTHGGVAGGIGGRKTRRRR
jgi:hypothetical protein